LAELVSIQAVEQANGSVSVSVGGDYLVADGLSRKVQVAINDGNTDRPTELRIVDNDGTLNVAAGKLKGLYDQRSTIVGDFKKQLNSFAGNLISTVNKIHSQGQASIGFKSVTGETSLSNLQGPLEQAGKDLIIENGSFNISVFNASTNTNRTFQIDVRQLGDGNDTSVNDLVSQIDAVDGINASVGNDGKLRIEGDSAAISFSFAGDNTGTLSALGINTFFSGTSANDIQVKSDIQSNPQLLALSLDGPGNGARNALALSNAFTASQSNLNGLNIQESYENFVAGLAQQIDSQETVMKGVENFHNTLEAKHLSVTGVSLDEEAAKLLMYQRAFQASSKVISTVNSLFDVLMSMV
jgi:flagellar hook-associated protein 1 FlgK